LERLPEMPQFRWRLVDTPFGVDRPHWVEDPDLDPDYHIRRVTVPAPGGDAELDALVGELVASKLDRNRPLWEIYLIDGLEDGRVAMLTKMHHSLVDGISGAGLMQIMLDITPDPRPPSLETEQPLGTESPPTLQRFVRGVASSTLSTPGRMATFATQTVRQGVTAATRLLPGADDRRWPAMPYQAPRTPSTASSPAPSAGAGPGRAGSGP
jgi:diacylglycerol O-acyltransferase / wax synthase